jgi:hypothetical protein
MYKVQNKPNNSVRLFMLAVVTVNFGVCKSPVNLITNPNPVYSHTQSCDNTEIAFLHIRNISYRTRTVPLSLFMPVSFNLVSLHSKL